MWSRRQFIKVMGALGSAVMAPFEWFGQAQASSLADQPLPPGAELYGDFLLLSEGEPVPDFVQYPSRTGDVHYPEGIVTRSFDEPEALAREAGFPLYTLGSLPAGLRLASAYTIAYKTGELDSAWLGFEGHASESHRQECMVSIRALPHFPTPFPLWSSRPVQPGVPVTVLEKSDFLGRPGIRVIDDWERVYYWINDGVLYTLMIRNDELRQIAESRNHGHALETEMLEEAAVKLFEALTLLN